MNVSPFLLKYIYIWVWCFMLYDNIWSSYDHMMIIMIIWWHWHIARIMSSQKIYGLCGLKHHIVDIRDNVTRRDEQRTREDSATQPMDAGGWVSQLFWFGWNFLKWGPFFRSHPKFPIEVDKWKLKWTKFPNLRQNFPMDSNFLILPKNFLIWAKNKKNRV